MSGRIFPYTTLFRYWYGRLANDMRVECGAPSSYATGAFVRNYDLDFLKHFSMVIGFLAVVTLALLVLANHINGVIPPEVSPTAARATQARIAPVGGVYAGATGRSEEHTSELQSLMRISYAVFCLKQKTMQC